MNAQVKRAGLFAAGMGALGCVALFGGNPVGPDLRLINRLDEAVQVRFQEPMPARLGMSRVITPQSFGEHFRPNMTAERDFDPENAVEKEIVAALEERHTQVGFYLMGAPITHSDPSLLNFRALKGPGAVTRGTPRPSWYPLLVKPTQPAADSLPDWNAIYPIARQAMQRFQEGGAAFETATGNWSVAARPVIARQERCVSCHNNSAYKVARPVKLGQAIGGVLYVFRSGRL